MEKRPREYEAAEIATVAAQLDDARKQIAKHVQQTVILNDEITVLESRLVELVGTGNSVSAGGYFVKVGVSIRKTTGVSWKSIASDFSTYVHTFIDACTTKKVWIQKEAVKHHATLSAEFNKAHNAHTSHNVNKVVEVLVEKIKRNLRSKRAAA